MIISLQQATSYKEALKKLQALVIADSFETKFVPLTGTKGPQCLLPIANVPNLHYIIEFLVANKVKEIIIVTSKFRTSIVNFIKQQNYASAEKI